MKKITNLIIVDASGSMEPKRKEVVSGLTELLTQIKADAKRDKKIAKITTIVVEFSSYNNIKTILNIEDSIKIDVELAKNYRPNGSTALFDAIGYGFRQIPLGQDGVFINILTDGEENDSKEFTGAIVKDFITMARDRNWAVVFMGANEEALDTAKKLNVSMDNFMKFADNSMGVNKSFNSLIKTRSAYYVNNISNQSFNADQSLVKD